MEGSSGCTSLGFQDEKHQPSPEASERMDLVAALGCTCASYPFAASAGPPFHAFHGASAFGACAFRFHVFRALEEESARIQSNIH